MTPTASRNAAEFTGTLWAAIHTTGGPRRSATAGPRHWPAAYDTGWLAALPLPIDDKRPTSLPVALLEDRDKFDLHTDAKALADAYISHPRTRAYQDIGRDTTHAWYSLTARHLGRLAKCANHVMCSIYQSRAGEESLGWHKDTWYGAIVQVSGAKIWKFQTNPLDDTTQPSQELTTEAGDILLLPKGALHTVVTPKTPGHSVHLAFAIDREPRAIQQQAGRLSWRPQPTPPSP